MAEIAMPRQSVTQAPQPAAAASPLYHPQDTPNAGPFELIPNPDFTFPQHHADEPAPPAAAPRVRPMSLQAYPAGRRGSAPGRRQQSVSALPAFSFDPAGLSAPAAASSSLSPMDALQASSRPIGHHRRGGSELIGGNARLGTVPLVSTSPTRGEGALAPPSANLRPGPPGGRPGHRHRRSAALSSHDLSDIMRSSTSPPPVPQVPVQSAPVTPLVGEPFALGHSVNKSLSQPSLRENAVEDPPEAASERPQARPRVGFASEVEYIRPLSTISSETETSMSTVRGHSTTNSLSSIVSAGNCTPPRLGRPQLNTAMEKEGRPSTAGAILDGPRKSPHFAGDLFARKRPVSALLPAYPTAAPSPSSRESAKRRNFFRLERRRSDPTIPRLKTSLSDPALHVSLPDPSPSPQKEEVEAAGSFDKAKTSSRRSGLRPRKVKSWANSIISRKGRHAGKSKKRAPTPPLGPLDVVDSSDSEDWDFEANFDVDNTVTIVSKPDGGASSQSAAETDIASWKPRALTRVDSDTMSPVIDLDAALGPFNTPHGISPGTAQRGGFGAHRRALHSAGGTQNHRRTESAPALVPFELRASTLGTTTMADVFEEEEPEEEIVVKAPISPSKVPTEEEEGGGDTKIQVVETESDHKGMAMNWNFNDGLGIKHDHRAREEEYTAPLSPLQVPASLADETVPKRSLEVSPIEVVEDYEEPRTSSLTHSSDSTVTQQMNSGDAKESLPAMSLPLPLPQQNLMTPDTFTTSFSSPDFRSSEASLDTPRLGTSTSSMTDYQTLPSPHFGEPGPEFRASTDVPSLSSSRSTMTSAMQSAFPPLDSRRPSDRSTSFCSVPGEVENRRPKRFSIVSLSRLTNGSSSGERSKLSIEQRPQSEYLEPSKELKKKHRRLSKLKFWKPKEASRA